MQIPMHRCPEAAMLAELLRASLAEVVDAANVCGHRPIKVSPRTVQQVQTLLRVCEFHKVGWSLESGSEVSEGAAPGEVDVVLSLELLSASNESAGAQLCDADRDNTRALAAAAV